jgi:hypothetical protein
MLDILLQLSPPWHICVYACQAQKRTTNGYSRCMRKWLLFVLACCSGFTAIGQVAPPATPPDDDVPLTREQRRIEIRTMLTANRNAEPLALSANPAPALRQLSTQQRAEMREQLRRHQPRQHAPP